MKLLYNSYKTLLVVFFILLLVAAAFSLSLGTVRITAGDLIRLLAGYDDGTNRIILFSLRLPRVIQAAFVGAGLSVVGTFLQGLLRNPMADPYVLGVSSGAAFGATFAIISGLGTASVGLGSFLAALGTIYAVYMIAKSGSRVSMASMLLAGIAISAFMSSIISLMMLLHHDELSRIVFWTMGSFSLVTWRNVLFSAPLITAGCLVMFAYSRELNAIMTGEEIAEHLGVNTEAVKKVVLTAGALVTAAAVAVTGIIGFVGLIVPHICRLLVGPDNRILVPFAALAGAIFLILADTLARLILAPAEMPTGIITAAVGGPFFIYLLIRSKMKHEGS
ncbi:MAG: iron ABC transporter permease [Peptococcaceae bacterium]|nr:iron ABC transporter permease [Peptococcaceae bacterium]MDH7526234.1 iron ABC transporter permease [Peptococcaceae bacterium]